jgi:hypothetical protein
MRRERFTDDDVDQLIDDMSEKEILWGIFEQQIAATKYLRTIAFTLPLLLALSLFALAASGL